MFIHLQDNAIRYHNTVRFGTRIRLVNRAAFKAAVAGHQKAFFNAPEGGPYSEKPQAKNGLSQNAFNCINWCAIGNLDPIYHGRGRRLFPIPERKGCSLFHFIPEKTLPQIDKLGDMLTRNRQAFSPNAPTNIFLCGGIDFDYTGGQDEKQPNTIGKDSRALFSHLSELGKTLTKPSGSRPQAGELSYLVGRPNAQHAHYTNVFVMPENDEILVNAIVPLASGERAPEWGYNTKNALTLEDVGQTFNHIHIAPGDTLVTLDHPEGLSGALGYERQHS